MEGGKEGRREGGIWVGPTLKVNVLMKNVENGMRGCQPKNE